MVSHHLQKWGTILFRPPPVIYAARRAMCGRRYIHLLSDYMNGVIA